MNMMDKFPLVLILCVIFSSIAAGAINDGLVAYWPLDSDFLDASDNDHHASKVNGGGSITLTGGLINGAVDLGGNTGDALTAGRWNPSEGTGQLSISQWVKWKGGGQVWQGTLGKRDNWSATEMMWQVELTTNSTPQGYTDFKREGSYPSGGFTMEPNVWNHIVVTFDGSISTFYANGVSAGSSSFSFGSDTAAEIFIGACNAGGGNTFNGFVDEVALWNRPLTADEIAFLYNNGLGNPVLGAKVEIVETDGDTVVMEEVITDSFTVTLTSQPASEVTITLDPSAGGANGNDIRLNDRQAGESLTLIFSAGDWDVARYVTVAAVTDGIEEEREVAEIGFTMQSADTGFDGGVIWPVTVTIIDSSEQVCPRADLDGDCKVGLADMILFAEQWLDDPACIGLGLDCADLIDDDSINIGDFSVLADNWGLEVNRIVINEFMASNGQTLDDEDGQSSDWIEVANVTSKNVDIGGWFLTDDPDDLKKWQFPQGAQISAKGYLIVFASGKDRSIVDMELHTNFNLDAGGDYLALAAPDGRTIMHEYRTYEYDQGLFGYPPQERDISYGINDQGQMRYFAVATPGDLNEGDFLAFIEEVRFSHAHGFYDASFDLALRCGDEDAVIRYTTDGSEPTDSSNGITYTGPITIGNTTCVRAAAFKIGSKSSAVKTRSYLFNVSNAIKSLPVISIVGDSQQSLYEPYGIMAIVGGYYSGGVWQSDGPDSWNHPTQRGIDFERPVSVELINADGSDGFQINCGIRVAGSDYHRPRYTRGNNWNNNYDKYSFKFFFRSEYGESRLNHDLFPEMFDPQDSFKAVVVRGGHNDVNNPFIKDELSRRLHQQMGGVGVIGTVASLFINGEYKSYFNPCERLDHDFFQDYFNSDYEWDVITQRTVRNGDGQAWNNMLNYVRNTDLSIGANYDNAGELIDIVDFIDYLIAQLYSANWDWPSNNWTVSRERSPEGKFRFHLWDVEGSMETGYLNSFGFDDFPSWAGSPKGLNGNNTQLSWIYRALKANEEFRVLFGDRAQKHFFNNGALTESNIEARFLELKQMMSQVLPNMNNSIMTTWIPNRGNNMIQKFKDEDLLTSVGPQFYVNGSYQHGGFAQPGDKISMVSVSEGTSVPIVSPKSNWRYLDNGSNQGTIWREPNFIDTGWASGYAELGYGDGDEVTTLSYGSNSNNKYVTTYFRHHFNVEDPSVYSDLSLKVQRDDGAVVYLNGTELGRSNMPVGTIDYLTRPPAYAGGADETNFYPISTDPSAVNLLVEGQNVLAVEIHQFSDGGPVTSSDISFDLDLKGIVVNTGSLDNVYYTIDGTDPRQRGGAISSSAQLYNSSSPVSIDNSTKVKARVYEAGVWSALNEATWGIGPVKENLRITEIMYHPTDPNAEFIELQNIGTENLNLQWVTFTNGIDFTFGDIDLAAGDYILVVKNQAAFEAVYGTGHNAAGQYDGSLNNGGERIVLVDAPGNTIHNFRYKDGWFDITDGGGFSLMVRDVTGTDVMLWGDKSTWQASTYRNGSPGAADGGPSLNDIVINEILAHSDIELYDWIELHNTTDSEINIGGWFLSDSDTDDPNLMKYRIAEGTTIPENGYKVFYENEHFGILSTDPGHLIPFALSENGETVYLSSGQDDTVTGFRKSESFGASLPDISFGRYEKSTGTFNFVAMSSITPNTANAYPAVGPVVITEIMYHPAGDSDAEYVELMNISGNTVALYDLQLAYGWRFSDDGGFDFFFPSGAQIGPGERILLVKNETAFDTEFDAPGGVQIFQWSAGSLGNGGEQIQLSRPGDIDSTGERQYIRVDRVVYDDETPWPTGPDAGGSALGRINNSDYGNDVINWQAITASPGQ